MGETGYAQVGDLEMYYEIHGSGVPLVLGHGAYMSVDLMGPLMTGWPRTGRWSRWSSRATAGPRTPTVRSPTSRWRTTRGRARHLRSASADSVGYSMGARRAPARDPPSGRRAQARRGSASYTSDGMHSAALEMFPSITPELFAGSPMEAEYLRLAPNPGDFPKLVENSTLDTARRSPGGRESGQSGATMVVVGDSDVVRLAPRSSSSAFSGRRAGRLGGLPKSRLAVLPDHPHVPPGAGVIDRFDGWWRWSCRSSIRRGPRRRAG